MNQPDIIVATITLARDEAESQRLGSALTALTAHGYPIIAADGGSQPDFLHYLHTLPGVSVYPIDLSTQPRLQSQVKKTLAEAAQRQPRYVLYTEPDKEWFFEHRLATFVAEAQQVEHLGIGVAARDETSFQTFPAFQQYTETVTMQLYAEVVGQAYDILFGPLLLNPRLLPHMERLTEDLGWGWRPFVMVIAQRLGMTVAPIILDLPCPVDQRDEDDKRARLYRMEQLAHNAKGLVLGAKWSL